MATDSTTRDVHIQIHRLASARFARPLLHLTENTKEARAEYIKVGVPLHTLAVRGNWKDGKCKFEEDENLVRTAITKGWATPLHVAAQANRFHFVEELVKLMGDKDLELQDYNGNTAFFLAAGAGNPRLAEIMMNRNISLPTIRGENELTPLHFAVIQGKDEMARFLYHKTTTVEAFQEGDWTKLFLTSINADIHDLALDMLKQKPLLALARDNNQDTGLHLLARKQLNKSFMKQNDALELVSLLWTKILTEVDEESEIHEIIRNPSPLVFDAAIAGNFEFLAELLSTYSDLMWERDCQNRTIIHFAVEHRHARIFNLMHEIGSINDLIVTSVDDYNNNLLHLAAKLAPPEQLNLITGAAFQLMHELLWFEEVKKIMPPLYIEMRNSKDLTAREVFTKEHEKLLEKAENWMKGTANSCMLVSTVIATGVFSAAFSLPGGNNDSTGIPNYFKKPAFLVFTISDAIALISSATSTLIFLSILISRYAESDFYKLLPLKLIFGLITLFISIAGMMVAFSSALVITYDHGLKWVPGSISVLAFLLIPLFLFLQFSLWFEILYSTYYCRSLFRPHKAYALLGKSRDM